MMEQTIVCRAWKSEQLICDVNGHIYAASKEALT